MKTNNFFSKAALGVLLVICIAMMASQADAELRIDSVYPTMGIKGTDLPVTISGSGFDTNTRVSMYPNTGLNQKRIVGSVDTPDYALDIAVDGNYAYIACGNSGLQIIDIGDPFKPLIKPSIIGWVDTPGYASGIAVAGNYAYVADGNSGLQIIDISKPSQPIIIAFVYDSAYSVSISGNYAYIVGSSLQVIDITNPLKPIIVGSVYAPGLGITVAGNYAYVSGGYNGLQVIEISKPSQPIIIGSVDTPGYAKSVSISANYAYVADDSEGLQVIDVSNPSKPYIIRSLPFLEKGYGTVAVHDVIVNGKYAYIITSKEVDYNSSGTPSIFYIIDISNPSKPVNLCSVVMGETEDLVDGKGLTIFGNYAYVADYNEGLRIIDIKNIIAQIDLKPSNIVSVNMSDYAIDMAVVGNYAYVISLNKFYVIDISNPSKPVLMGTWESNPDNVKDLQFCNDIKIFGSYAYLADSYGYLHVIDISNPSHPILISTTGTMNIGDDDPPPGNAWGLSISGNYAYVLDWSTGFEIIDISQPSHPIIPSVYSSLYDVNGDSVMVVGNYAYVTYVDRDNTTARLIVINISDSENPFSVGFINLPSKAYDIKVVGNYAYVVCGSSGLQVIDVSNPSAPAIIGSVKTGLMFTSAEGISVIGNYAYVADSYTGLQVIDISKPSEPIIIGWVDTIGSPFNVTAVEKYVYALNSYAGLVILSNTVEAKPVTINSSNSITVTLPGTQLPGDYTIRVFNSKNEFFEVRGIITFSPPEDSYILDTKAIIVTGDQGVNPIREQTLTVADYAYKTLLYQGYTAESINYLSFDTSQPGVDGKASLAAVSDAINTWSIKDPKATELLIYLVGHGSKDGYFIINDNEKLTAEQLDQWLDNIQNTYNIPVTVIYEACYSGSFLPKLTPPPGRTRIVISSASKDEEAKFLDDGRTSFSYQFWNAVYQGNEIGKAFRIASNQMKAYQTPRIDTDGDGIGTDAEIALAENMKVRRNYKPMTDVPYIYKASEPQVLHDQTSAKIQAGVSYVQDGTKVQRVWATIEPPDFNPGSPVTSLPEIELTDPDGDGIYEGIYNQFTQNGTYKITVCAMNQKGMYALFKQTTVVRETGYIAGYSQHQNILKNSTKIWAALKPDIPVSRVWAEIIPPISGASPVEIGLSDPEHDGVYEAVYDNFSADGTYKVNLYAKDLQGYVSPAVLTTVTYGTGTGGDDNEADDTFELARFMRENQIRHHNFHVSDDTDWIKIVSTKNITYNIRTLNHNLCGTSLELLAQAVPGDLNGDKKTDLKDVIAALRVVTGLENSANILSDVNGDGRIGLEEAVYGLQTVSGLIAEGSGMTILKSSDTSIDWTCPETGIYYLKIRNTTPDVFGQTVKYDIQISRPTAGSKGTVRGTVKSVSGEPVSEARIISSGGGIDLSMDTGAFLITDSIGKQILTVQADGYEEYRTAVTLTESEQVLNIVLNPNR